MGIGDDIKAAVDALVDTLGDDCTLDGATALGKCSYKELNQEEAREYMGIDYQDELSAPYCIIEVPATASVVQGSRLTIQSRDWVVRRVMKAQAGGVLVRKRCICHGELI